MGVCVLKTTFSDFTYILSQGGVYNVGQHCILYALYTILTMDVDGNNFQDVACFFRMLHVKLP